MPLNQPQIRVTIGGVVVAGVIAADIERVAFFAADRFSVTFSVAGSGLSFDFFTAAGLQVVAIEIAVGAIGFMPVLTGQVDNIYSSLLLNTVTVTGRDLSARLIDSEISQTFANQTASQIATSICARHGLTASVTATSALVGQYYELDHARSALGLNSRAGNEWNLLTWLASIEGFSVSVFGTTLTFGIPPIAEPFLLGLHGCMNLAIDTASSLPATAIVKSWDSRNKTAVTHVAGVGTGATATLIRPGLTSQQASQLAQTHLAGLQTHATILIAAMPGETSLAPGSTITLIGTASSYDRNYAVDVIRRTVDAERGFVQHVRAHALN